MLHLDFETRSVLDLTKVGVYRYVKHHSTEIMCMAYAEGNGPVQIWDALSDPKCESFPWEVVEYVEDDSANCVAAWNANFERVVWNSALSRQLGRQGYDLPRIENQQWWCIMADAAAMGIPLKLDTAAKVITGIWIAVNAGWAHQAFTLSGGGQFQLIGVGMYIALIMFFNVWVLIWPAQQKILGLVEASDEAKAKAGPIALAASRTNLLLSLPMLYCMVSANLG